MFFDWKIQLEEVQLTRDLKDDTINYQEIRLQSYYTHKLFGSVKTPVPHFK